VNYPRRNDTSSQFRHGRDKPGMASGDGHGAGCSE
jgi:hypothetical protein